MPRRMFKNAVQQGSSERRGESPLSDARTQLADFFNILLSLCIMEDDAERKA